MERNVANVDTILNFSITTLLIQEFDQFMAKGLGLDWVHTINNLVKTIRWNKLTLKYIHARAHAETNNIYYAPHFFPGG